MADSVVNLTCAKCVNSILEKEKYLKCDALCSKVFHTSIKFVISL